MSSSGITINSNIASLQAQRQLLKTSHGLQKTFERLGSGLRIVRASDDAAGLAIASSLNTDNRVYTQGVRNLNDGLSYLNIADGAIDQLKTIVIRCRELATQAANGTMTSVQRNALDQEAQALSREYNRILATSEFNGSKVFDASNFTVNVQYGYGANESISAQTGEGAITPETARVSTNSSGAQPTGGGSFASSLSADGRYLAFRSQATNLVAGDTNGRVDIFVKDLLTGTTTRVSTSSSGTQTNDDSFSPTISADGRYVAFMSNASNLISGDTISSDIFIKDLLTETTTRVSTNSSGAQANGTSFNPTISADGRYVAFMSNASNLVSGDTNGQSDIFIKDLLTGTTTRVSTDSSGAQVTGGSSLYASISADGKYVAFESTATNLVSGDTNGISDVFVKDLLMGTTTRISTDTNRTEATGGGSSDASINADGRYVVFTSGATNLVSGDTNGVDDIFIKDLLTGTTTRISTDTNGTEATGGASNNPSISADGRYAAFESIATNLVSGDTNAQQDIFAVNNTTVSSAAGFASVVRPLVGISLKERTLALIAQGTLDDYLDELNTAAGFIGSSMSRFSVAISTLGVRTENVAAAESRITDVDVADESSNLTRRNILQQAASAVLAQANQQPAIALSLLR